MAPLVEKKVAPTNKDSPGSKSSKMHRRSRSGKASRDRHHLAWPAADLGPGCFTCRLRRKKCDEGKTKCKACRHLGLDCEYKRPHWWSNSDTRRKHKEHIKTLIKRTKTTEKSMSSQSQCMSRPKPMLPAGVLTTLSDPTSHLPGPGSDDPQDEYDPVFDQGFVTTPGLYEPYSSGLYMPHPESYNQGYPWEIDIKTERHTYINDELARRDSSISTFNTFAPPPPHAILPSFTGEETNHFHSADMRHSTLNGDEDFDMNYFGASHLMPGSQPQCSMIPLEDCDRPLFDHLLENVLPLLFPILEANQPGFFRADVILPALENNKAYLHACLVVAATHLKYNSTAVSSTVEDDLLRHKHAFVKTVVDSLNHDMNHHEMLDALLGIVSLQGCIGSASHHEKELIPWHQHFQSVGDVVQRLNLTDALETSSQTGEQPSFNMTLTAWVDILGATMLGKPPRFANSYRNMLFARASAGLERLMGCDDLAMYVLSEVACLDSLKMRGTLNDIEICSHVTSLAKTLDAIEPEDSLQGPQIPYSRSGALRPKQLSKTISAIFRKAVRIYLCSLVPEFNRYADAIVNLVSQMADLIHFIPSGPAGFDRSLVWPMLICGANSIPASPFRRVLAERCEALGDAADHGSFGRMVRLLHEVWRRNDDIVISAGVCEATPVTAGSPGGSISTPIASANAPTTMTRNQNIHWRDVMQQTEWDFLLI